MPDQPVGDERAGGPGSLEEWIESVAASQDLSKDEVRNQMMSSYWILSELTGMMADSGQQSPDASASSEEGPTEVQAASESTGPASTADVDDTRDENLTDLIELVDALNGSSDDAAADSPQSMPQGATFSEGRLQSELDRLHDDISQLQSRIDRVVDKTAKGAESAASGQAAPHPDAATRSDLEETTDDVAALQTELSALNDQFEDEQERVDENFSHVEEILEFLVERVDVFDDKIDDLANQVTLLESGEPDPLTDIKEAAITHGVSEASCKACGQQIDISLLERPVCPNCSQSFGGLRTTEQWFGLATSAELTLRSPSSQPTHSERSQASQPAAAWDDVQSDTQETPTEPDDLSSFRSSDSTGNQGDDDGSDDQGDGFVWSDRFY